MIDKYGGLDVYMATTSYCVREGGGKVVAQGTVETTAAQLVRLIRVIRGKVHL